VSSRRYQGPALDGTVQHLSEAPHWQGDGETVDVVDDRDDPGDDRVENVPTPAAAVEPPERDGQSTWDDWDWRGPR
jgi:hypothetical protein